MKKLLFAFAIATIVWSCKTAISSTSASVKEEIQVNINLNEIKDDKVLVTVKTPKITTDEVTYYVPKTVPGTYSEDNFGKYIEDVKAFDKKGNALIVKNLDTNSWSIANAKMLDKITYLVNDTYDTETGKGFGSDDIFSPTGSNIDAGKNVMLNTHCFVGYFSNYMAVTYKLSVSHPAEFWGATSLTDLDAATTNDLFVASRYAELVENPIMYSKPNYTTFKVDDMEILIAVYSPTGKITAEGITPEMKKVMTAQKKFLGPVNSTKKYSILLYLSTMNKDAQGFGALEHPTSTTVVFPEMIPNDALTKEMKDVVSHEFFHIVTPLTIHSQEIQNFDYNAPKMSEHLWMYEGVTEYFANLFQINQGLIDEEEFYSRIAEKIENASKLNDTMPFTTMSKNVLVEPYKAQYLNVYEKGALIGMCLDIIIRENSNGQRGILDLMHKLSNEFGVSKAFNDEELFAKITQLTYPEVGEFLKTYVSGSTPIPYDYYLSKVGVTKTTKKTPTNVFLKGQVPYITVNQATKEIIVLPNIELNDFYTHLGLKGNDILLAINDKNYSLDNIYDMISESEKWKENDHINVKIKREGKEQILKGNVKLPYEEKESFEAKDATKTAMKEAWLRG
ncbi:MAG TPA: peptidase M61 [Flavobacterium sp.]|nr:peptidase M61 [Flavobacterium sp.]HAT77015.1 peptidase M61 [Flavobacterium sp.]HAT80438.1 peptidase M61 [Flavobacterium sp.]